MMNTYLIRPSAPLVFRSGKPFGSGSSDGANFPWPSSIAGALRTAFMDAGGASEYAELNGIASAGPFLALLQNEKVTPLVHKPADALYLLPEKETTPSIFRLQPGDFEDGSGSNLPEGLMPLVPESHTPPGKPQKGAAFWTIEDLLNWQRGDKPDFASLEKIDSPAVETRTHVALDRKTLAAEDGRLFQVQGLDFSKRIGSESEFALIARFPRDLENVSAILLGGERRLSWINSIEADCLDAPEGHLKAMGETVGVVIHLATPAIFKGGWKPGWLGENLEGSPPGCEGLVLRLRAAAMERWQSVSGWDLALNEPRAARKAVPAGSAYWFEIVGTPPQGWQQNLWLSPLSDDEQDRRNGFGIGVAGPWNNKRRTM